MYIYLFNSCYHNCFSLANISFMTILVLNLICSIVCGPFSKLSELEMVSPIVRKTKNNSFLVWHWVCWHLKKQTNENLSWSGGLFVPMKIYLLLIACSWNIKKLIVLLILSSYVILNIFNDNSLTFIIISWKKGWYKKENN